MASPPRFFAFVLGLSALLGSCAGEPANWMGPEDATHVEEEFAMANCECFQSYFSSIGINVDQLLAHYDDFAIVKSGTPRSEVEARFPELKLELAKIAGAKAQIQQTPCYRSLEALSEEKQPQSEKVLSSLQTHCRLHLFLELY
jgi:hypothetical protein